MNCPQCGESMRKHKKVEVYQCKKCRDKWLILPEDIFDVK